MMAAYGSVNLAVFDINVRDSRSGMTPADRHNLVKAAACSKRVTRITKPANYP